MISFRLHYFKGKLQEQLTGQWLPESGVKWRDWLQKDMRVLASAAHILKRHENFFK